VDPRGNPLLEGIIHKTVAGYPRLAFKGRANQAQVEMAASVTGTRMALVGLRLIPEIKRYDR
jgi:hypothetical protein